VGDRKNPCVIKLLYQSNEIQEKAMSRVTAADILKVVPITRKTLWLWQKKYGFFPDPVKEAHPGGKGIVVIIRPGWRSVAGKFTPSKKRVTP